MRKKIGSLLDYQLEHALQSGFLFVYPRNSLYSISVLKTIGG
jgi:hypothetical protein